ncbi:MAG TPA: aromatic-ring-hydroxylating dioxygenase subunit beta [Alphaproteobacteria bacterium]|nr:aromatic-ring-hydroxylating dioxygenase subunit beta [Alphaproteobacteria bacterium]
MATAPDLREIEQFLHLEARLLDENRYDEWLDLYTDTATYWVPLERGQKDPYETSSLIFDDRKLMEARVRQFHHPRRHAQTPASRTCHMLGHIEPLDGDSGDAIRVRSNFILVEFRADRQFIYGGACEHRLVRAGAGYKIAAKRIDLINSEGVLDGISILL